MDKILHETNSLRNIKTRVTHESMLENTAKQLLIWQVESRKGDGRDFGRALLLLPLGC